MDIVVTIPKSEYVNDDAETRQLQENGGCQFWAMKRRPANLNPGDRIYFVRGGRIESSMRVFDIRLDATQDCDTTLRTWKGNILYMDDLRVEDIGQPVKGFQGFRYKWW